MKITVVPPEPVKPKYNLEVTESELEDIRLALEYASQHCTANLRKRIDLLQSEALSFLNDL